MADSGISDRHRRHIGGRFFDERSNYLLAVLDSTGKVLRVNPTYTRVLGWTEAELQATPQLSLAHPDDIAGTLAAQQQWLTGGIVPEYECRLRCRDGSYRWISWSSLPLDESGFGYLIGHDVTGWRNAETAINEQAALLRAVIEGTTTVVFAKDRDGRYILMHGYDQTGRGADEYIGRLDSELTPPGSPQRREVDLRIMASGRAETAEQHYTVGESQVILSVTKAPFRAADGTVIGVVGVSRDITEQRRLETQIQHAQKMEAVGRLAGGIAHDFNNLLTAILSFSGLARNALPADHPVRADLDEVQQAAEAAAVLTQQMLAFTRQQVLAPRPLVLNDVIRKTERMLLSVAGEHVTVVTRLDRALKVVEVDPGQIEQVLVNLAVNAGHAMPDGGTLSLVTANVVVTATDAARLPDLPLGTYVRLAVRDTGIGMDEATRARIFEPFFTTKAKGTGLGLASVYGIIKQSRGEVFVESRPGAGTEFAIYLPATDQGAAATLAPASGAAPAPTRRTTGGGHETILVVEDNVAVRHAESRMLQEAGYRVIVASNGVEALALSASLDALDLVVSDVMMPEMGGRALLTQLREARPSLPVLLVSGHEPPTMERATCLPPGTIFLAKPFDVHALLGAVATLLGRADT